MNTGERSINNRIHGNLRALYEQAKSDWSFEEIKTLMKMMAIENGYPCKTLNRKTIKSERFYKVPRSLSGQNDSIALILNETIQVFADENNFWLIEYDENDKPFRTIGGRKKSEMEQYINELREKGLIALAIELGKEVHEETKKAN